MQLRYNGLCERVWATEHAPRDPINILERRHALAEIGECPSLDETCSPARGGFFPTLARVREPRGTRVKSRAFETVQTRIPCATRLTRSWPAIAKMLCSLVSYSPLAYVPSTP